MKKKLFGLFTFIAAIVLAICALTLTTLAEDTDPTLSIDKFNLTFEDNVYIKYAVKLDGDDELAKGDFGMLYWTSEQDSYTKGTESSSSKTVGYQIIDGQKYYIFEYTDLSAKQMTDVIYARAYLNIDGTYYYSNVRSYSIVEYASGKLGLVDGVTPSTNATFKQLLRDMLAYGASAQKHFAYKTDNLATDIFLVEYEITLTEGTLSDGTSGGIFHAGDEITLVAPEKSGYEFLRWETSDGKIVGTTSELTVIVNSNKTYVPSYEYIQELEYTLSDDGTYYSVTGRGTYAQTDIVIPETYNDLPVKEIGDYAFFLNCEDVTSVTIPDSVTTIGYGAFAGGKTNLTSITLGNNVKTIGEYAFSECSALASVIIPDSVTSIGSFAFYGCSNLDSINISSIASWCNICFGDSYSNPLINYADHLYLNGELIEELVIPEGVNTIPTYAFYKQSSITSITVSNGVSTLGDCAFYGCTGLTTIVVPESLTSIGNDTFRNCSSLTDVYITSVAAWCNINFENSIANPLYYADNLYLNGCIVEELVIPDGVTSIPSYCFYEIYSITKVSVPNSVKTIGDYAFYGCTSLKDIAIPDGVESIGNSVFEKCSLLSNATIGNSTSSIGARAFYNCSALASITLGSGVENIGDSAFYGCSKLENVYISDIAAWCNIEFTSPYSSNPLYYADYLYLNEKLIEELIIPDKVTVIPAYAFYKQTSIKSVTTPDSVLEIGNRAFYACSNIETITISSGSIGEYAFSDCSSLINITLKNGVTSIAKGAFDNCINLLTITIPESVTYIDRTNSFYGCLKLCEIINLSSREILAHYNSSAGYYPKDIHSGESKIKNVDGYLFYTNSNGISFVVDYVGGDTALTLPESYNGKTYGILYRAFARHNDITSVIIPSSISSITESAFSGCSALTSVTLPNSITHIYRNAFSGCSSLSSIVIPDGVTYIGDYAFNGCNNLTSVTIPSSVITIGDHAFYNCTGLINVYINDLVAWCNITYGGNVCATPMFYADFLYLNNSLIKGTLIIPDGVVSIPSYAFARQKYITSIILPNSITSIGEYAFSGCENLFEVINKSDLNITVGSTTNGYVGYYALEVHSSENKVKNINDFLFYTDFNGKNYLYRYVGNKTQLILPENCNGESYEIYKDAFREQKNITSVTIPDSITSIGDYSFYGCSGITSITIPNSVTNIGYAAFSDCVGLEKIYFNVPTMNDLGSMNNLFSSAGKNSNGIKVVIGKNVNKIPAYLFYPHPDYSSYSPKIVSVEFEEGSVCESIGTAAFYYCTSLTSLTIPDCVTTIGNSAFAYCSNLTSATIPSNVTSIGYSAFSGCSSLESITLPFVGASKDETSSTHFGYIFGAGSYSSNNTYVPKSLKTVVITSASSISASAFRNCTGLSSVTIPDSVTSIGSFAFSNCPSISSITIPFIGASKDGTSNTHFGYIFGASSYLYNSTYVPKTLENVIITSSGAIDNYAFYNCTGLTSVIIPDSITSIGDYAFFGCSGLTSVTIPNNVTSIGSYAFRKCTSLTSVIFSDTNGWWYSSSSTATSGTTISADSLADPATAATYLESGYYNYYWFKD